MDIGLKIRSNPNFHYIRYDPQKSLHNPIGCPFKAYAIIAKAGLWCKFVFNSKRSTLVVKRQEQCFAKFLAYFRGISVDLKCQDGQNATKTCINLDSWPSVQRFNLKECFDSNKQWRSTKIHDDDSQTRNEHFLGRSLRYKLWHFRGHLDQPPDASSRPGFRRSDEKPHRTDHPSVFQATRLHPVAVPWRRFGPFQGLVVVSRAQGIDDRMVQAHLEAGQGPNQPKTQYWIQVREASLLLNLTETEPCGRFQVARLRVFADRQAPVWSDRFSLSGQAGDVSHHGIG